MYISIVFREIVIRQGYKLTWCEGNLDGRTGAFLKTTGQLPAWCQLDVFTQVIEVFVWKLNIENYNIAICR